MNQKSQAVFQPECPSIIIGLNGYVNAATLWMYLIISFVNYADICLDLNEKENVSLTPWLWGKFGLSRRWENDERGAFINVRHWDLAFECISCDTPTPRTPFFS